VDHVVQHGGVEAVMSVDADFIDPLQMCHNCHWGANKLWPCIKQCPRTFSRGAESTDDSNQTLAPGPHAQWPKYSTPP
jgi:hypothetical protein